MVLYSLRYFNKIRNRIAINVKSQGFHGHSRLMGLPVSIEAISNL